MLKVFKLDVLLNTKFGEKLSFYFDLILEKFALCFVIFSVNSIFSSFCCIVLGRGCVLWGVSWRGKLEILY